MSTPEAKRTHGASTSPRLPRRLGCRPARRVVGSDRRQLHRRRIEREHRCHHSRDSDTFSLLIRKTAHFVEYAMLAALVARALRSLFPRFVREVEGVTLRRTAIAVMSFGALVAFLDEFHQLFVSSRRGSLWDALIGVVGLSAGLLVTWVAWRRQRAA